jgi:two-component system sensor histidine kinase YesM
MVELERYDEAIRMVTALASLFRISLSKGKNIIPIRDEIEHAKNYLSIQQVRFKNKFTSTFDLDPEILNCATIKLILQPLIENAIYYGMEYMDGDGEIIIRGFQKDGDLYIEVSDNGLGIPEEVLNTLLTNHARTRKKGSGIGMYNVHQRIQLYFGMDYGLEIESELDEGTTVRIHLPMKNEAEINAKEDDNNEKA